MDIQDISAVVGQWGQSSGFNPAYDQDHDGDVDIVDVQRVAGRWGWGSP